MSEEGKSPDKRESKDKDKVGIFSSTILSSKSIFWAPIQRNLPNNSLTLSGKRKTEETRVVTDWKNRLVEAKEYKFTQDADQPLSQLQRNTVYLKVSKDGQLHYRVLPPQKLGNVPVSGTFPVSIGQDFDPNTLTKQQQDAILRTLCDEGQAYIYEHLGPKFYQFQAQIHRQTEGLYCEQGRVIQLDDMLRAALGSEIQCALVSSDKTPDLSHVDLSGCNIGYVHVPSQRKLFFVNKYQQELVEVELKGARDQQFLDLMQLAQEYKSIRLTNNQLSKLAEIHPMFLTYIERILENRKKHLDFYHTELGLLCLLSPMAMIGGASLTGIGKARILDPTYLKLMYAGIGILVLGVVLFAITNYVDNKRVALEPWSPLAPLTNSEIQGGRSY